MNRNWTSWIVVSLATLIVSSALAAPAAHAQSTRAGVGADRLFLAFIEDATIADRQWWEARLEFSDFDRADSTILRGLVALQPMRDLEIGATVGFGSTDAPRGLPDGSGATDLDVWGKWHLGETDSGTSFAVGGVATVPTGDDTAGLGYDAFNFEGFGSLRHRLSEAIFSAHFGIRFNGDGTIQGVNIDGKTSGILGAGILFPASDRLAFVGEARVESERFEGADSDFRVLAGLNWRPSSRGIVRVAVALGLTDSAPDGQLLAGYAFAF